jgi:ElaB/YqjD/DUF883 family membrane-anchored ribosome-binding protein
METHFENLVQAHSAIARERVLQDFKTLARDSEALLKATAGDLSDKAREARARLGGALERAKATCAELQEQTIASAKAAAKRADAVIRDHPYESVGIAFGIGLLVGVLITRK